jgi:hypothetical protein
LQIEDLQIDLSLRDTPLHLEDHYSSHVVSRIQTSRTHKCVFLILLASFLIYLKVQAGWLGEVFHTCNPSTQEAGAGKLRVQGQPELHRSLRPAWTIEGDPVSKNKKKKKKGRKE